ncbi:MAG: NAD(P)-dependent alcohol dehydrogenase [Thermoanaerobaculia bacterium]|nr:NAD(P)-dependent alcohol dehydrogenase [Thermoanaerobaculia bacterium]
MKAIVFTKYGSPDVLELREVEKPVPGDDEVLIRVHAVSLNDWDWGALDGTSFVNRLIFGLLTPKKQILGSDIAGRIEAVGARVRRFRTGDEVFGDLSGAWGGLAEYVCTLYGAEVTAVDSAAKLDMLRAMGARHVMDYTQENFTETGKRYDLILDVKTTRSILDCARALSPHGRYVTVGGSMARLFQAVLWMPWISMTTNKKIRLVRLQPNKDLAYMRELFEEGKVVPVIDRPYTMDDAPEAFRHFGEGLHKGKVVITV